MSIYRTGQVQVTQGNDVVVGTDTLWASSANKPVVGDLFTIDMQKWYEIIAVGNDSSITLHMPYAEADSGGFVDYGILATAGASTNTRISQQVKDVLTQLGDRVTVSTTTPTALDGQDGDIWIVPQV